MNDPRRWADGESDATGFERDLVRASRELEPPEGEKERIWVGIAASIGPGDGPGGSAAPAAAGAVGASGATVAKGTASAVVTLGLLKWAAIGAIGAGAALGVHRAASRPEGHPVRAPSASPLAPPAIPSLPAPPARVARSAEPVPQAPEPIRAAVPVSPPAPSASLQSIPAQSATTTGALLEPPPPSASPPASAPPIPDSPDDRTSRLRDESRMVGEARSALRRGDALAALSVLDALHGKHPAGGLSQESEALRIEALARLGRRAEARARAENFLRLWPSSPYVEVVAPHAR